MYIFWFKSSVDKIYPLLEQLKQSLLHIGNLCKLRLIPILLMGWCLSLKFIDSIGDNWTTNIISTFCEELQLIWSKFCKYLQYSVLKHFIRPKQSSFTTSQPNSNLHYPTRLHLAYLDLTWPDLTLPGVIWPNQPHNILPYKVAFDWACSTSHANYHFEGWRHLPDNFKLTPGEPSEMRLREEFLARDFFRTSDLIASTAIVELTSAVLWLKATIFLLQKYVTYKYLC